MHKVHSIPRSNEIIFSKAISFPAQQNSSEPPCHKQGLCSVGKATCPTPSPSSASCSSPLKILFMLTIERLLNWYFIFFLLLSFYSFTFFINHKRRNYSQRFERLRSVRRVLLTFEQKVYQALGEVQRIITRVETHKWLELSGQGVSSCHQHGFPTSEQESRKPFPGSLEARPSECQLTYRNTFRELHRDTQTPSALCDRL